MHRVTILSPGHILYEFLVPYPQATQIETIVSYTDTLRDSLPDNWILGNVTPVPQDEMDTQIRTVPMYPVDLLGKRLTNALDQNWTGLLFGNNSPVSTMNNS